MAVHIANCVEHLTKQRRCESLAEMLALLLCQHVEQLAASAQIHDEVDVSSRVEDVSQCHDVRVVWLRVQQGLCNGSVGDNFWPPLFLVNRVITHRPN